MPEPVQFKFTISSSTLDCTEPPPNVTDKCRITVFQDPKISSFNLTRDRSGFKVAPEDADRIKKSYPSYRPPAQQLKDYIEVTRDFYNLFGDINGPTSIVGGIRILTREQVFEINDILVNFLAHGNSEPKTPEQKMLQEMAVGNSVSAFADPSMGSLIEKTLSRVRENTKLSGGVRARAKWLQRVMDVRKALWDEIKPKIELSVDLGDKLKGSTLKILKFLFGPHILEDQGVKDGLFSGHVIDAAQKHHDVLSQIDPQYSVDQNYYAYMATILRKVKKEVNISEDTVKGFDQRINQAIGLMEGEAKRETARLLPHEDNLKAFKISLVLKYGTSIEREAAIKILTDPITVKPKDGQPTYVVPMATIDNRLREWVKGQTSPEKKRAATEAILYVLDQTMERGETMEAYWNGDYRRVESFFGSDNFGKGILGGNNNRVLQALIVWARSEANDQNIEMVPGQNPHVALRKWTLLSEVGVAGLGVGTYFIPYSNPETEYYGKGASIILAGSGAGAAAGNFLSYEVNAGKNAWIYDVGGAVLGGLAAGLIYGLTTTKPDAGPGTPIPDQRDPGDRSGKTPFGP